MKLLRYVLVVAAVAGLGGCVHGNTDAAAAFAEWQPRRRPVLNAGDLGSALEARWSPQMLRAYCAANPPTPGTIQNLVARGEVWEGVLYEGKKSEVGRIWWYATAHNGKLGVYSLNVTKGGRHWLVELGGESLVDKPPLLRWIP